MSKVLSTILLVLIASTASAGWVAGGWSEDPNRPPTTVQFQGQMLCRYPILVIQNYVDYEVHEIAQTAPLPGKYVVNLPQPVDEPTTQVVPVVKNSVYTQTAFWCKVSNCGSPVTCSQDHSVSLGTYQRLESAARASDKKQGGAQ